LKARERPSRCATKGISRLSIGRSESACGGLALRASSGQGHKNKRWPHSKIGNQTVCGTAISIYLRAVRCGSLALMCVYASSGEPLITDLFQYSSP
jgi:hypothetical protein